MIRVDYQIIMRIVLGLEGVENEESMWKHSPKSWGMPKCVLLQCVSDSNSVSSELNTPYHSGEHRLLSQI